MKRKGKHSPGALIAALRHAPVGFLETMVQEGRAAEQLLELLRWARRLSGSQNRMSNNNEDAPIGPAGDLQGERLIPPTSGGMNGDAALVPEDIGQAGLFRKFTGSEDDVAMVEDSTLYTIEEVNAKFKEAKEVFDLVIYSRIVHLLIGDAPSRTMVSLELGNVDLRFLILLLRYKGNALDVIQVANRTWGIRNAAYEDGVESLKHAKKRLLKKIGEYFSRIAFDIPRNKGNGYCCRGTIKACMFLTHDLADQLRLKHFSQHHEALEDYRP